MQWLLKGTNTGVREKIPVPVFNYLKLILLPKECIYFDNGVFFASLQLLALLLFMLTPEPHKNDEGIF
jgi:hypothetical protein